MDSSSHDDDDEYIWTTGPLQGDTVGSGIKEIENTLKCLICQGWLNAPVSPKRCGHTFCSLCIRSAITQRQSKGGNVHPICPICRDPIDQRDLVPNRSMADLVDKFRGLRGVLRDRIVAGCVNGNSSSSSKSVSVFNGGLCEDRRSSKRLRNKEGSSSPSQSQPSQPYQPEPQPEPTSSSNPQGSPCLLPPLQKRPQPLLYGVKKKALQEMCRAEGILSSGSETVMKERILR